MSDEPDDKALITMRLDAPDNTRQQDVDAALTMLRLARVACEAAGGNPDDLLRELDDGGSIIFFGPDTDSPDEVWLASDFWYAHAPEEQA